MDSLDLNISVTVDDSAAQDGLRRIQQAAQQAGTGIQQAADQVNRATQGLQAGFAGAGTAARGAGTAGQQAGNAAGNAINTARLNTMQWNIVLSSVRDSLSSIQAGSGVFHTLVQQGMQLTAAFRPGQSMGEFFSAVTSGIGGLLAKINPAVVAIGGLVGGFALAGKAAWDYNSTIERVRLGVAGIGRASLVNPGEIEGVARSGSTGLQMSTKERLDVATTLAGTGKVGKETLGPVTDMALGLSKIMGVDLHKAAEVLAKDFANLGNGGAQHLKSIIGVSGDDADRVMHQMEVLDKSGDKVGAQTLAIKTFSGALKDAAAGTNLFSKTYIATTNALSNAWFNAGSVVGGDSIEDQIAAQEKIVKDIKDRQANPTAGDSVRDFLGLGGVQKGLDTAAIDLANKKIDELRQKQAALKASGVDTKFGTWASDIGDAVRQMNSGTRALEEMKTFADNIREALTQAGIAGKNIDKDGKFAGTARIIDQQRAQGTEDHLKGGAEFAAMQRQAMYQNAMVGMAAFQQAAQEIRNQFAEDMKRATAPGRAPDEVSKAQDTALQTMQTRLDTLNRTTSLASATQGGLLSRLPPTVQQGATTVATEVKTVGAGTIAALGVLGGKLDVLARIGMTAATSSATSSNSGGGSGPASLTGTMKQYAQAIMDIESGGGNYGALGKVITRKDGSTDRAYGAYQVMGANIPSWTREAGYSNVTKEQFLADKEMQDKVFAQQFQKSIEKYGSPQQAANVWFTGRPIGQSSAPDANGTTPTDYVSRFNASLSRQGAKSEGDSSSTKAAETTAPRTPPAQVVADYAPSTKTFNSPFARDFEAIKGLMEALKTDPKKIGEEIAPRAGEVGEAQALKEYGARNQMPDTFVAIIDRLKRAQGGEGLDNGQSTAALRESQASLRLKQAQDDLAFSTENARTATEQGTSAAQAAATKRDTLKAAEEQFGTVSQDTAQKAEQLASATKNAGQAMASTAGMANARFGMEQLGRDQYEAAAYATARSTFNETSSPEAQGLISLERTKNMLGDIKSTASGALSGFISDLAHGQKLTDALKNMFFKIADKLISMASDKLISSLFNGIGGGGSGGGGGKGKMGAGGGGAKAYAARAAGASAGAYGPGFADGGPVSGPGGPTSDVIPAMLSNGEFVINAAATQKHKALLHAINTGRISRFASGGEVGAALAGGGSSSMSWGGSETNNDFSRGSTHVSNITVTVPPNTSPGDSKKIAAAIDAAMEKRIIETTQRYNRRPNRLQG